MLIYYYCLYIYYKKSLYIQREIRFIKFHHRKIHRCMLCFLLTPFVLCVMLLCKLLTSPKNSFACPTKSYICFVSLSYDALLVYVQFHNHLKIKARILCRRRQNMLLVILNRILDICEYIQPSNLKWKRRQFGHFTFRTLPRCLNIKILTYNKSNMCSYFLPTTTSY